MAAIITLDIIICLLSLTISSAQNITFVLEEDRPNSTLIGSILTEAKLSEKYSQEQLNEFTYDFYEIKDEHKHLFRLDQLSSHLFTNTIIDRERDGICRYLADCYFDFKILAHKASLIEIISTRVNITDRNDNTPTFQPNVRTLNISENRPQYSKFKIEGANDLDTGAGNGIQSYSLISQSGKNDLQLVEEKSNNNWDLFITVQNELDRETTSSYVLYVKAVDGGNPVRTGTLTLSVNILDENDNKPLFLEADVDVNIDETSPAGTLVKHLTATDRDAGKNGQVYYRLKSFQQKEINESFSIDATGKLTTLTKLEYEKDKVYTIVIEAVDKGDSPLSSQATVRVHVQDSGNNAPEVSLNFLSHERQGDNVVISEDSELDFLVAVIKVKDTDSGDNGVVSCFTYSTYFGLSRISNTDYRLIVQHKLDRESAGMSVHNVTVTCKDKGQPEMDGSVRFQVILKDENDNPPRFSKYYYQVELQENTPAGHTLLTVQATDLDEGKNAELTYEIEPITDTRFSVNPQTGEITTREVFDKETTATVTFEVIARDHGDPSMKSKTSIVVDIKDVNDNHPEFVKMIFDFQIQEGLPKGTKVDIVSAIDHDQGPNGEIVYSFDPDYDNTQIPFTIFSTGEIITNTTFNREETSHYEFPVIAVDKGTPSLTSTVTVRVRVTDKNDNRPIFIFPKNANNTVSIPNTLPTDSIIATIQAYDVDYEENGNINFFIISGNEENMFYLNPSTGSLHVKKVSHTKGDKNFKLKINARDRGYPSLNSTAELNIVIQYMNATTDESKEYILIVVCVVCVTFVIAVALIAVICFLRKKNLACGKSEHINPPHYDHVQAGNNSYPYALQNDKNKQRVKFSEPGTTFTKQQMMETFTLPRKDSPRKEKEDSNYTFDRQLQQKPPEESETSSKTDSGHGSEEDFTHNTEKNSRTYLNNQPTNYNNSSGVYVVLDNKNKPSNMDIARNSNLLDRPPVKSNRYLDDSLLTASLNSMYTESNPPSSRHPSHSQSSLSPTWPTKDLRLNLHDNSPFYMPLGSIQSRDDDGSTTTSGSYTINHEDLDDDLHQPRDLFV